MKQSINQVKINIEETEDLQQYQEETEDTCELPQVRSATQMNSA